MLIIINNYPLILNLLNYSFILVQVYENGQHLFENFWCKLLDQKFNGVCVLDSIGYLIISVIMFSGLRYLNKLN